MDYIMIITDVRVDHEYKQILIADCVLWVPEGAYTRLASLDSMFFLLYEMGTVCHICKE